jgi:hypothetical protein
VQWLYHTLEGKIRNSPLELIKVRANIDS